MEQRTVERSPNLQRTAEATVSETARGEIYPIAPGDNTILRRLHIEDWMLRECRERAPKYEPHALMWDWYATSLDLSKKITSATADMMPVVARQFVPVTVHIKETGQQQNIWIEIPAMPAEEKRTDESRTDHSQMHGATEHPREALAPETDDPRQAGNDQVDAPSEPARRPDNRDERALPQPAGDDQLAELTHR